MRILSSIVMFVTAFIYTSGIFSGKKSGILSAIASSALKRSVQAEMNRTDFEPSTAEIVSAMKAACPIKSPGGVTLVDVTNHPENQINCFYEVPNYANFDDPGAQRVARELAIQQFHSKGLVEPTKRANITWNYVYKKSYGAVAWTLKIRPEDLDRKSSASTGLASVSSQSPQQNQLAKLRQSISSQTSDGNKLTASGTSSSDSRRRSRSNSSTSAYAKGSSSTTSRPSSTSSAVGRKQKFAQMRFDAKVRKNALGNNGRQATAVTTGVQSNPFASGN